jgi:hypothetical protein
MWPGSTWKIYKLRSLFFSVVLCAIFYAALVLTSSQKPWALSGTLGAGHEFLGQHYARMVFSKMAQYSLHTGVHNGANLIFRRQCAFGKTVVLQLPGNRCCVLIPDQGKRFFSSPNHSDRHEGPPRDRDDKSSVRAKLTTHLHVRMTRATPPLCTQGQLLF